MRFIYTLIAFFLCFNAVKAQITLEEFPLESNPVLQRIHAKAAQTQQLKLSRLFGETSAGASRDLGPDCIDDGIYENGETIYVLTGETFVVCLDTTGFVSLENLSVEGNSGTIEIDSSCITYIADPGLELSFGDTMRVELCLPDNSCVIKFFPVIVKRLNQTYIEPPVSFGTEQDIILCASPANFTLPAEINSSNIPDCHNATLSLPSNGNSKDSCLLLTSRRFGGADTVCLEVSNNFCITDTYKFPYRIIADTLNLPFMDDFSYDGPYPGSNWLDTRAFVNTTWSVQPPSVGFATLDGLDEGGTPYGGGYGRSDFLTSNYIDLSPYNANSDVYLSFYVQAKGKGYQPNESQGDSLVLEFKAVTQDWIQIDAYDGIGDVPIDFSPPYAFKAYHINTSAYFYKGFQFRFVNYGANFGIRDIWHVDYVRLVDNEIPDTTFEDIAFTNLPNFILNRYSSMPWRHFEGNETAELRNNIDIELYSQFPETTLAEPSGSSITELVNGVVTQTEGILLEDPQTQRNVPPAEHKHHVNGLDIDPFPPLSGESMIFELKYFFEVAAQNPGLFPQVAQNDTVRQRTLLANYFAYDDGSAETAMKIGFDQGWRIASEFEANLADTLRAIRIHFPHYTNMNSGKFHLKVYVGALNSEPVYEKFMLEPVYPNHIYDTLGAFTTYRLTDDFNKPAAVYLPPGKFYIALEQASNSGAPVRIGLDKNTPEAKDYQYLYDGDIWIGLGNNGAAMLRPVVGDYAPSSTSVADLEAEEELLKIFPNPSSGIFTIDLEDSHYEDYRVTVYNTTGKLILDQKMKSSELDLSSQLPGIYFIRINNLKIKKSYLNKISIFK